MNAEIKNYLKEFISSTYLEQALGSRNSVSSKFRSLLAQRRIPETGWSVDEIEMFIREVALWDSNNFPSQSSVGEREGRCLSDIVRRRHWGLIHGIGRSGDVNAEQPKATGSSFLLNLTKVLVHDALVNIFGITHVPKDVVVLPIATGMSIMMGMMAISAKHVEAGSLERKNVIWSRIDQKSCIKAMTANKELRIHVVEQVRVDNPLSDSAYQTDIARIEELITQLGADTIHSIVLTTSTFAPRSPDNVPVVARLCKANNIPLVVNNAYGLQCTKCCHLVNEGLRTGRVDLVVQSTDKNFLVPVGGSVVFGAIAPIINKMYPGRASMSPILDLLITLLEVGRNRYMQLLSERKQNMHYLVTNLKEVPQLVIINNSRNTVSLAMTHPKISGKLGSALFLRNVSGSRVFTQTDLVTKVDQGVELKNFGAHADNPISSVYLNAACAIGTRKDEVDTFMDRLKILLGKEVK